MTETNLLDITLHEPSETADEAEMLLFGLDRCRATFAWKCGGLDAVSLSKRLALAQGCLDQPTNFTPESGEGRNLRRVLVDLHEEYARHLGHADLLREAIDGLVGEDPPQPSRC